MKKRRLVISLAFVVVCAVTSVLAAMYQRQPISIEKLLTAGETVSVVALSDGELWFKTEADIAVQLKPEDFVEATRADYFVPGEEKAVPYYEMNGGKKYSEQELLKMMNISPELWYLGDELPNGRFSCNPPYFVDGDRTDVIYNDFITAAMTAASVHAFEYWGEYIHIYAAPAPVRWQLNSDVHFSNYYEGGGSIYALRPAFGDLDSRIGDIPVSVKYTDSYAYSAFFTVEQTTYQIRALAEGVSQEEFIKLLISICEAPHPEKENLIDLVLE